MSRTAAILTVCAAAVLGCAACSSSKSSSVTVSPACSSAMSALAGERGSSNASDARDTPPRTATLHACQSKAEWLAAANGYRLVGHGIGCIVCPNAKATDVLATFCADNATEPPCK